MKDLIYIKSFPNGLTLHLDEEMPFEQMIAEIGTKFEEARKFFGKVNLALSVEGRTLTEQEEIKVLETVQDHSDVKIICIVSKDVASNKRFVKALNHIEKKLSGDENGHFLKGGLRDGEVLETDTSIIVIGDVEAGCAVISAKNIIILGALNGEAYAGGNGLPGAFVAALEMAPERIKIGDFKYKPNEKKSLLGKKKKALPQIATVKDGKIVFEAITKEQLSSF